MFTRLKPIVLLLVAVTMLIPSTASGRGNEFYNDAIRAGWYGIFPQVTGYVHSFSKPIVKYKGYSQTARYVSKEDADKACEVTVGLNHHRFGQASQARPYTWISVSLVTPNTRKVLMFHGSGQGWEANEQEAFVKRFNSGKIAQAVSDLPRQNFRITKSSFDAIPAKPNYEDIVDWLGTPDEDVGSGIHIMVFPIAEGGRALVGTPDLKKVLYLRFQTQEETDKWREP